jgi:excinuclease ABC subunit C
MRLKWLSEKQRQAGAMAELREALGLPAIPRRIEGYDISTTQGQETVGSICSRMGRPASGYRRFNHDTGGTTLPPWSRVLVALHPRQPRGG